MSMIVITRAIEEELRGAKLKRIKPGRHNYTWDDDTPTGLGKLGHWEAAGSRPVVPTNDMVST